MFNIYRATVEKVRLNKESAKTKLSCPVLAVGSKNSIGKEVHRQMERVAEEVCGHQSVEECPKELADVYLGFLRSIKSDRICTMITMDRF